ncbi:MAG: orotidine-5'-phosphate decarboxylase [Planctomycetota bacterium]|nr:orotidine-5'-phosphate decarboxylase [Planctomycetota bacterium]
MSQTHFADRLALRIREVESRLVVGIDPRLDRLPAEISAEDPERALASLGQGVIEAVAGHAAAVKPQVAFFERYGWRGWRALEAVCRCAAQHRIPVILDAKRGDIGSTAVAYAEALLGDEDGTPGPFVDAVTINPYLGTDSVEPFLAQVRDRGKGVFVLARTSNPSGGEIQCREQDTVPIFEQVARSAESWGVDSRGECGFHGVGLVVGATYPDEISRVRQAAPGSILLIPGVGTQGGSIEALAPAFDENGLGAVVNSSRGIVQAFEKDLQRPWQEMVEEAARETRMALQGVSSTR